MLWLPLSRSPDSSRILAHVSSENLLMIDVAQCLRIAARVAREKPAAFEPASQRALWEVMYPYFRPARPANGDDADAGVFSVAPLPAVRGAGLALASHAVPGVGVIGARIPPPVSLDSTEPACVVPFVLPAGIRHSDRFSCPVWRSNDTVVLAVNNAVLIEVELCLFIAA